MFVPVITYASGRYRHNMLQCSSDALSHALFLALPQVKDSPRRRSRVGGIPLVGLDKRLQTTLP